MSNEVIKYPPIPNNLKIERGALAGWVVYVDSGHPGFQGQLAAFSNSDDMIEWLKKSIQPEALIADMPTPSERGK